MRGKGKAGSLTACRRPDPRVQAFREPLDRTVRRAEQV